jgi:hypothetical protein
MGLTSIFQSYNFSKAEIDGSRWATLDQTDEAKTKRLAASINLVCPAAIKAARAFPQADHDYEGFLNTFRWTLGFEGKKDFHWTEYLADEAVNVQLIFDIYDRSISIHDTQAVLESLAPSRPIPESFGTRLATGILRGLGSISKESTIPFIKSAGPTVFSAAADLVPSTDSKNQTLWYLHRFYVEPTIGQDGEPCRTFRSYGLEWRISRRLISTVGSRTVGAAGVLFFLGPDSGVVNQTPVPVRVRMCFGLKPKQMEKEWMFYLWRPICPWSICPECSDCRSCSTCRENAEYQAFISNNWLGDWHLNTTRISRDLPIAPPDKKRSALTKQWTDDY